MPKEQNKETALAALLECASVSEAARQCNLSDKTLRRYLEDPEFVREYRTARRQTVDVAIAKLQNATGQAADALIRNLYADAGTTEIRAAQLILDNAIRGVELTDLAERLEAIEQKLKNGEMNR